MVLPKRYVHDDDDDDDDDLITIIIVIIGDLLLTICLNPAVVSRFEMMVRTYHYMFVKDVETTQKNELFRTESGGNCGWICFH